MADKKKRPGSKGKGKYALYRAENRSRRNSIKRILESQGEQAVLEYAKKFGIEAWARRRIASLISRPKSKR